MPHLQVTVSNGVATLTLNRPHTRNALSQELMTQLKEQLNILEQDACVRCLILTGAPPSFCAGADVAELAQYTDAQTVARRDPLAVWQALANVRKPIVAAVFGHCLGGGLEIALMCDFIICAQDTLFGQPEVKLGLMPGGGGTQRLARCVGKARAMEVCLTGRLFNAQEALAWGVVTKVVEGEKLLDEACKIAQDIASRSVSAVQAVKVCVNQAFETSLENGLKLERERFYALFDTQGWHEGSRLFLQKKKS